MKIKIVPRFIAAASLLGLCAAGTLRGDVKLSAFEQAIAEADRATASYLTVAEHASFLAMFRRSLTGTDAHTIIGKDGSAYVATGDIPAMWLRDSAEQKEGDLHFAREDKRVADGIKAVIQRQAMYIARDPYANAFREDSSIWERKFELDSLSFPILLTWKYWKVTGDDTVFTPAVRTAFARALETMLTEQDHEGSQPGRKGSPYHFVSDTQESGKNPVGYTGMIWTAFRPSDDECIYNFLIPAQIQAAQALAALAEMETFMGRDTMAGTARKLGAEVRAGIEKYGIVDTPLHGRIYAYEVDGLGHANLMDDANIPNLLSIPYLGYVAGNDPVYANTRRFILSPANPYFYAGTFNGMAMEGIGSIHTPPGMIWPLAQVMQGMTAADKGERIGMLRMLINCNPGTDRLHESYDANNPKIYTREEFDWVNRKFMDFVMTSIIGRPPIPTPVPGYGTRQFTASPDALRPAS